MSFTTRCPACGTMFRVVPDQLKVSDGWVRCGHCSDVFDAMLNLQTEDASVAAAPSPPPQPAASSRVVIRRVTALPPAPAHYAPSPSPLPSPPVPSRPVIFPRSAAVPAPPSPPTPVPAPPPAPAAAEVVPPVVDSGLDFVSQFDEPEQEGPDSEPGANDAWDGEWLLSPHTASQHRDAVKQEMNRQLPRAALAGVSDSRQEASHNFERELAQFIAGGVVDQTGGADDVAELVSRDPLDSAPAFEDRDQLDQDQDAQLPAFVVQGRRDAFWRLPVVRGALLILAGLMSGLLAAQWAVHERDQLSARYPAMRSALQAVCDVAGCDLAAPRHIEAVAIDSSTLTRKLGQLYAFDLVLKNSAAMPVAMPALELSLTDGRDREIARRVFLPEEMPGTPTVVPANGSLAVSMRLSLSESDLGAMAGYRALVFYP